MADLPSVAAHRGRILSTVAPLPPVTLPIGDALGLVLGDDVVALLAVPRFDHAAMDGYAVRAADVAAAAEDAPARLRVAGVLAAGDDATDEVVPGTAMRIMTGAPVPAGADTVVPFELTDRGDVEVAVGRPVDLGRHIRRTGEDVAAGEVAVRVGTRLAPRHLGLLASVGCGEVLVRPRPRVAVVATGAELVAASYVAAPDDEDPESAVMPPGSVPDSNSAAIAAAVTAAGGDPVVVGPASDDPDGFAGLLAWAAEGADLIVTTGGVSAGDHDVVKAALRDRDGMWFGSVAVKPGRPQGAGVVSVEDRAVPVVCLPGTPVAAFTSFQLFAAPAIRALAGRASHGLVPAILAETVAADPRRTLVLPGAYDAHGRVGLLPGHAGHSQALLARADVLLVVPPGEAPPPGASVDVVRLSPED